MVLESVLSFAHTTAAAAVESGGRAIDATVGNGHDTLFLAQQVGPNGAVIGFDIQPEAITRTEERLIEKGVAERVQLYQDGHEHMIDRVPDAWSGTVDAVMFNLGYLPGHDKSVITRPETTIAALKAARKVLRPGGVITTVLYAGHTGGAEEAEAVETWAAELDQKQVQVLSYRFVNQRGAPPRLLALEKKRHRAA